MPKIQRIFFISTLLFFFSTFTVAQQVPDYLFLEVLDSKKQPVAGAEVQTIRSDFNSLNKGVTNDQGGYGFYLPWDSRYGNLNSYFTVLKEGYFTYHDFGGSGGRGRSNAQIEFFKIPQTAEEKSSLGDEQLKREFMWAAKTGDAAAVRNLLKKGINPNLTTGELRGISGRKDVPAILFAALSADAETVKTLLKAGVDVRRKEEPFRSILSTYLRADPFYRKKPKDEKERTRILNSYQDGVDVLLKAGADHNVEDIYRKKPVIAAAERGYPRAVKYLLDKGFSPNFMDERGYTLLIAAAGDTYPPINYSKVETVEMLLKSGADPNLSKDGCWSALGGAASTGDVESIRALIKYGAKINPTCDKNYSPLIAAIQSGRVEAAKLLIESGADIKPDQNGDTPLMYAATKGDPKMIQMLLDKGIPVNAKRPDGWTALTIAVNSSFDWNRENIEILLKAGADANALIDYPNSQGCFTSLIRAVENRYFNLIKILAEYKADVNLACGNGNTALVYAIQGHNPEIVKLLLELGANPNGEPIDKVMNLIKTYYKEGDYYRKSVDETIKLIEDARKKIAK